ELDLDSDHPGRHSRHHPDDRELVPAQRGRGNHPDGELAERAHGHLPRPRQVVGGAPLHDGDDAVQQGHQRGPGHHGPDGRPGPDGDAAAHQGAGAGERHRVRGRDGHHDQDGREPLLLEARGRAAQHPDRPALQLRPAGHQPADARPALLGQDDAAPSRGDDGDGADGARAGAPRVARRGRGGGRRRPAGHHHPQGLLARAHGPGAGLQLAQHQGGAERGGRGAPPHVRRRGAGQRGHRERAAGAPGQGGAARGRARDQQQAARAGADARRQRRPDRPGRGGAPGSARQPAHRGAGGHADRPGPRRRRAHQDPGVRRRRGGGHPHPHGGRGHGGEHPQGERVHPARRRKLLPLPPDRDAPGHRAGDRGRAGQGAHGHHLQRRQRAGRHRQQHQRRDPDGARRAARGAQRPPCRRRRGAGGGRERADRGRGV
ncbi:MAG: hypothetical protein AVDCRST_MAG68-3487, partial [uncultured Gemmatimonadetes bacterium]